MSIKSSVSLASVLRFLPKSRFHNSSELDGHRTSDCPSSTQIYGVRPEWSANTVPICNSDRISSLLLSIIHVRQRVFGLFSVPYRSTRSQSPYLDTASPNHPSAKPSMPESCVYTLQHTRNHLRNLPQIARKHCCERCKPKMEIASLKFVLSQSRAASRRVRHSCTFRDNKELELISSEIKSKENLRLERQSVVEQTQNKWK